ncbi:membrane associated rhomboid family serine protease [Chryseobacterium sediminis]|uniref:Membrane associated rhomboid family serine protease n=1 Tax=Chryseobacterium sediminis TaxID=1679494 RepID=A0ABR6Q4F9_9FLAO|nr:rhomboid family intramembrane serine protease [Chryseobacterium sediminis]MBB6332664.1 membrane associated rhomboid family serine protease [Chryseobacterium sediminis]
MFNNIPPITRNIIIINIVVYLIANFFYYPSLYNTLSGFYPFSPNFKSWQIITHMFMHAPFREPGGFMHILFNMFTLFSFGPILEQTLGDKKYLILYFASGLGSFFLFNLWNFVEAQQIISGLQSLGLSASEIYPKAAIDYLGDLKISATTVEGQKLSSQYYTLLRSPMLGASGAIFGVVAAFATLYPDSKIGIMFIPVPIKVKYLLPIIVVVSVYLGVSGNGGGIAHLAHVGGALVGWLLARIWKKHLYRFN